MIAFAFVLFALVIVGWLVAPNPAPKPAVDKVAGGRLALSDASA